MQVTNGANLADASAGSNTANTSAAAVTITGATNAAPALDDSGDLTLDSIAEDDFT